MNEMRVIFLLLFLLVSCSTFGKTTYISAEKLPVSKESDTHLQFIRENEKYFEHGVSQGAIGGGKAPLVEGLKSALGFYSSQDLSNLEVNLLLGDVSTYLFFLNEPSSFDSAVRYYKKAIQLAPLDYRAFWFMGNLYAGANDLLRTAEYFKMAQSRLPKGEPVEYWEQTAKLANMANMPSTCIYAMDRSKALLNRPSDFERSYGQSVRSKLTEVSSGRNYTNKELWSYTEVDRILFTSRPLGLNIAIEPEWELDISDFVNKQASFTITQPAEDAAENQDTTFSISVICKVASEGDDLKGFLNSLIVGNPEKKEIEFSDKYQGIVSYELLDMESNKEHGGSHQYLIGVRRKQPLYPGLSLEQPIVPSQNGDSQNAAPLHLKNRFAGTIFYAVKLEATEDVFYSAKRAFWNFFANYLFLE